MWKTNKYERYSYVVGGGFLRPCDRILETGDTHHTWWYPALTYSQLIVPLWLSDIEKVEHHHDVFTGKTKPCKLNKNDIIDLLHSSGVVAKIHKAELFSKEKIKLYSIEIKLEREEIRVA